MKRSFLLWLCLIGFQTLAAIPPAEKLLPADTLFMFTAPDSQRLGELFTNSPQCQLWRDPAMKPFRDHFMKKLMTEMVEPLEKEWNVKFSDYRGLAQGQFTFALVQNGWEGKPDQKLGLVLFMDTKGQSNVLKTNLANLKKKWTESGKEIKTEKIRDVEFTTLVTFESEIEKTWKKILPRIDEEPEPQQKPKGEKMEISIGQVDSLLLVGNVKSVIEKILARQAGSLIPALAEDPVYDDNHNAHFRTAPAFAWMNLRPLLNVVKNLSATSDAASVVTTKMLGAIGLNDLKSAAASYQSDPSGAIFNLFIGAPEASRQGIVKMLLPVAKDAAPPPFVPADTVKFNRWRLDMPKMFNGLEAIIGEINPAYSGLFKMILESAGKDQDPNFDLRKELIGPLGDDLIAYQKNPRGTKAEDLASPPTLYLIASSNAEKMASALKIGMASLGQSSEAFKEREFLGRKIYSFLFPTPPESKTAKGLHFAGGGGYVGLTTDVATLEEYLRSSETKGKTLAETSGLSEAAQKVGGTGTGLFGFENQSEQARIAFENLKKNRGNLTAIFGGNSFSETIPGPDDKKFQEWADFTLLPPFESVAQYFYFSVYAGASDASGFTIKMFAPTPPGLKK